MVRPPDQVVRSVSEIIRIGAVGINLEDGTPHPERPIRSVEVAVERIRAAREAARAEDVPLVIKCKD